MFAHNVATQSSTAARDPLWLCLHFAQLALDVFEIHADDRAIAVIEQRRIHCANRANLAAGLALATAQALHPDLLALERKPERERDYLHRLAHWAYQFTPGVVIANDNSLLLEIGSCRRLHRGAHNLLKKLRRSLHERQQDANLGLARTPKAAWLLAQCNDEPALQGERVHDKLLQRQLAQIPVAMLEIHFEAQRALEHMGITTLGALQALPSAALGKRFGSSFIDYLQKIAGKTPDPQSFFIPAPRFQHGLTFLDGIAQRQMLLFPMKRLLQALNDYLRARLLHCHTLSWQVFDAHRLQAEFSIELSRTQNDWPGLLELSRLKLEHIALTEMIFSVHLYCDDFFEQAPTAQQLFPDANDQREAAASLLDRLQARLGKQALQWIAVQDSHWPELAWQYDSKNSVLTNRRSPHWLATTRREYLHVGSVSTSMPTTVAASQWDDQLTSVGFYRPFWLLPNPQPLPQHDNQPLWPTPLTLLRGPERIGNHWWQEEDSERDYYIAQNRNGLICWIYCERKTQRWFLHGLFA